MQHKDIKRILQDYTDACALVRETEDEIDRLRSKAYAQDSVKGSMRDFPYAPTNIPIDGVSLDFEADKELREQQQTLRDRKAAAEEIKRQVDGIMASATSRVQRIIRYKYFQRMPWAQVALRLGGRATENSVKKEFERFLKKN